MDIRLPLGVGTNGVARANCYPPTTPLVAADASDPTLVLAVALRLKAMGIRFRLALCLDDERTATALQIAPAIVAQFPKRDDRSAYLRLLAGGQLVLDGRPQAELRPYTPAVIKTLGDAARLADAVVTQSRREAIMLAALLALRLEHIEIECTPAAVVQTTSAPLDRVRDRVLLWAPRRQPSELAIALHALDVAEVDADVVCAAPFNAGSRRLRSVVERDAQGAQIRARAVIIGEPTDPAAALAWAGRGLPLAIASTCGADEYLDGTVLYDPWDWESLRSAIARCVAAPPPVVVSTARTREPVPIQIRETPLVSVIVPTYNRPQFLPMALETIRRQDYPAIETIVVNNGGENVDAIVARLPNARVVNHERMERIATVWNAGIASARGRDLALLPDDDAFFPTHVSTLVAALERTGAGAANANFLSALIERDAAQGYQIYGAIIERQLIDVDPDDLRVCVVQLPLSVMLRREAVINAGGFDTSLAFGEDWDLWLRLRAVGPFATVDSVTSFYARRTDNTNWSIFAYDKAVLEAVEAIYAKYPLPPDANNRAAERARFLEAVRANERNPVPAPPLRLRDPIPLAHLFQPKIRLTSVGHL
jgi:glycosyltransferase involved in cell wall biosynthesis